MTNHQGGGTTHVYQDFDSQSANPALHMTDGTGGQSGEAMNNSNWLTALMQIGGTLYNAYQQRQMYKDQIGHEKEQANLAWERQLEMWNLQNQYNSPESMMNRFKAAGLNPNLIYGAAGAGNTAGSRPEYQPQISNTRMNQPRMDFTGLVGHMQDFRLRNAQIDNVEAQTQATKVETVNKSIMQAVKSLGMEATKQRMGYEKFKWDRDSQMKDYQMQVLHQNVERSGYDAKSALQKLLNLQQDEVLKLLQQDQAKKNLGTTDLQNEKLRSEILLNKYRSQFESMGVNSSDNFMIRVVSRILGEAGFKLEQIPDVVPKAIKKSDDNDKVLQRHLDYQRWKRKKGAQSNW